MFSQLMPGWMVFSDVQASAPAPTASRAVSSSGRPRMMQAASAAAVASPPPVAFAMWTCGQGMSAESPLRLAA